MPLGQTITPLTLQNLNPLYQTYLGRSVGKTGGEFYLGTGRSREQIEAEIRASAEAQAYSSSGQAGGYVPVGQQYGELEYRVDPSLTTSTPLTLENLNQIFISTTGRSVGKTGSQHYLNSGMSYEQALAEISASPEAQEYSSSGQAGGYVDAGQRHEELTYRDAPGVTRAELIEMYPRLTGRTIGEEGLNFYLDTGRTREQIEAEIAASDEAVRYRESGRAEYVPTGQQVEGETYRTNLATTTPTESIADVPTTEGGVTSDQIIELYQRHYGRAPGQEGAEFWLASGKSYEELDALFASEAEALRYEETDQPYYVAPEQQYEDVDYKYNVDPQVDPIAPTTRNLEGLRGAETEYQRALYRSEQGLEEMKGVLGPWAAGGQDAYELQLAFSGALGPEAQAEAYRNYKESPGQEWLREQSMREVQNYAASTGQTLGGNVLDEISRRAMGLAMQDYDKQYSRIGSAAATGGQATNIMAQQSQRAGEFDAGIMQRMGDLRYKEGQDWAAQLGQGLTSLAKLQGAQGVADADTIANSSGKLSLMVQDIAQKTGRTAFEVATTLANLATQTGSSAAPYLTMEGRYNAQGSEGYYKALSDMTMGVINAFDED